MKQGTCLNIIQHKRSFLKQGLLQTKFCFGRVIVVCIFFRKLGKQKVDAACFEFLKIHENTKGGKGDYITSLTWT